MTTQINRNDNDTIIVATVLPQTENAIQTSIAKISLSPNVVETTAFQQVLLDIPFHVGNADDLLKAYRDDPDAFLETLDEELIDKQLEQMQTVSVFVKNVEKARLEIKRYMNDVRDNMISNLDLRLNEAQYDKLGKAQADITQLKKDIEADRASKRWDELRVTFVANINRYPLIGEFASELADFSRFKLLFPKLVSGAKTRKVKEADHNVINETLYSWNTALEIIKENIWGLTIHDVNELLTKFKREPSVEMVNREGRQLKLNEEAETKAREEAKLRYEAEQKRMAIEEERRKKAMLEFQEKERLAKIAQDAQAQALAEKQRLEFEAKVKIAEANEKRIREEFNQFGGQYRTIFKESFPMFIKYLFENNHYHDVHSNPVTKAGIIYDIMKQVDNPTSVVVKETANDPQKILDLVRYVLDA